MGVRGRAHRVRGGAHREGKGRGVLSLIVGV